MGRIMGRSSLVFLLLLLGGAATAVADEGGDGLEDAARRGDAEALHAQIEASRGHDLIEARRARELLASVVPSSSLRRERAEVREALANARLAYCEARARGRLAEVRRARAALDAQRRRFVDTGASIRREALEAVRARLPRAGRTPDPADVLRPGEVYVAYLFTERGAWALLADTGGGLGVIDLGPTAAVVDALESVRWKASAEELQGVAESLRRLLVAPLALPKGTRRLLVSPDGLLRRRALGWTVPELDVAYVPSLGFVHELRTHRPPRGYGVLAVGDAAYERGRLGPRGAPLLRLRSTRREARAVGTKVLLGEHATEGAVRRALAREGRWRCLHFAGHGWGDDRYPALSTLVLAPTPQADGRWLAGDILRTSVPVDLVVLSASHPATGMSREGSDLPALPGAFLAAGASAVVASTGDVDDAATASLMEWFHVLWHPGEGREGREAAQALRQAQGNIRAQARWRHPRYWAPWVIWGLPHP